jgi:hypothetical protein
MIPDERIDAIARDTILHGQRLLLSFTPSNHSRGCRSQDGPIPPHADFVQKKISCVREVKRIELALTVARQVPVYGFRDLRRYTDDYAVPRTRAVALYPQSGEILRL